MTAHSSLPAGISSHPKPTIKNPLPVRRAIACPAVAASSARNRYPNSGSSRWASNNAFAR
jgi:hypothetical protein